MSKIKVNQVEQRSGATVTLGGGACKTAVVDATTVTLGRCGATVSLASGATQSGFGRTGTVDWCTTVKTSPLTAASGKGYMINTCGGVVTVTLPASPTAGDIVSLKDYKDTWDNNNVTLGRNSSKIGGQCNDATLATQGQSITMIYVDGTQGWVNIQTDTTIGAPNFISATGGTITTSGDYKIHTFNADGCFAVTVGASAPNNNVAYMVVAGGGGGGSNHGGGGGAGGFREGKPPADPYTGSPLAAACSALPVSTQTYPITVGGGSAGGTAPNGISPSAGSNSVFSTITSAGGGYGASSSVAAGDGGSGGASTYNASSCNGSGNTPPVSPPQGTDGGQAQTPSPYANGGGGGATAVGTNGSGATSGPGGAGATTSITASPVAYAGGGGGGRTSYGASGGGAAGTGGGGVGATGPGVAGTSGGTNLGGGGGGGYANCPGPGTPGGSGGSGVVIIRYKFQ